MGFLEKLVKKDKKDELFFKGVLIDDGFSCGWLLDDEIKKYKEALNNYLNGIEFPDTIDLILKAIDSVLLRFGDTVSDAYIIGDILYSEKNEEGIQEIILVDQPLNFFYETFRNGIVAFRFCTDSSQDSYYAMQISGESLEVKLFKGQKGLEGQESFIASFSMDCTPRKGRITPLNVSKIINDLPAITGGKTK